MARWHAPIPVGREMPGTSRPTGPGRCRLVTTRLLAPLNLAIMVVVINIVTSKDRITRDLSLSPIALETCFQLDTSMPDFVPQEQVSPGKGKVTRTSTPTPNPGDAHSA